MQKYFLSLILVTFIAEPVVGQPLLLRRSERVISQAAIPSDATAVAYMGTLRFGIVKPPYGFYPSLGRGVIYQRSPDGALHSPRIMRNIGFAFAGQYGIGFPLSLSIQEQVTVFTPDEYRAMITRPHWQGRVQAGFAAMAPGYNTLVVVQVGPVWGQLPGKVVLDRSIHVGLFASVFVVAGVSVTWVDRDR